VVIKIEVKDNNIEQALRVLKRKLQRDGFFKIVKLKNTYEKKMGEKKGFEEMVMRIAKRDGLVFDELKLDTKFYPTLVKAIFQGNENEDHLFALKLALFEVEKIRDSKDSELKKKLRQAKTKIEALKTAFEICE